MFTNKLQVSERNIMNRLSAFAASSEDGKPPPSPLLVREEELKRSCRQDFAALRHSLASLSMSEWANHDPEVSTKGRQAVEQALAACPLPLKKSKKHEIQDLESEHLRLMDEVL